MLRQFIIFGSVGVIGTLVHYLVLILLVQFASANVLLATSLGYLFGAVTNYLLNYWITFRSGKRHLEAAPKFFVIAAIGFLLNGAIMSWLHQGLELHYLLAQVLATGGVLVWGFLGNRLWTFR